MFRIVASALLVGTLLTGTALAQTNANMNASNNSSAAPPAVTTSTAPDKTSAAPVAGRNSFTMREASKRIMASGYSNVKNLKKDNKGIWRGQAMKDGQAVGVALDYQGNVVSQ